MSQVPSSYNSTDIFNAANTYGVPSNLFASLINTESQYNPNAVSSAGAIGLTQLLPGTASDMGVNPYNPQQNLMGGAQYLAQQYQTFGNWTQALEAYNAGPGNVSSGKVPQSSVQYANTILQNAGMSNSTQSGYDAIGNRLANQLLALGDGSSALWGIKPTAAQKAQAKANDSTSFFSWVQAKIGDIGIIVLGGVLIAGSVLIANKSTVINLAKAAA